MVYCRLIFNALNQNALSEESKSPPQIELRSKTCLRVFVKMMRQ
jgi:hypothetical protein